MPGPSPLPHVPSPLDDRCCWADLTLWQGQTALSSHHMVPRCLASGLQPPRGPAAYGSNELFLERRTVACRMRHSFALKSWLLSGALPPGVCPRLHKGISICHRHSGPRTIPASEQLPCARAGSSSSRHPGPGRQSCLLERAAQRLPQEGRQISWGAGPGPLPTSLPHPESPTGTLSSTCL